MDIREPSIERHQILVLEDEDFTPEHVCVVTGCGTGIGRATAIAAAVNGLTVVGLDINAEEGEKTREIARALNQEIERQTENVELIASENFTSAAVRTSATRFSNPAYVSAPCETARNRSDPWP